MINLSSTKIIVLDHWVTLFFVHDWIEDNNRQQLIGWFHNECIIYCTDYIIFVLGLQYLWLSCSWEHCTSPGDVTKVLHCGDSTFEYPCFLLLLLLVFYIISLLVLKLFLPPPIFPKVFAAAYTRSMFLLNSLVFLICCCKCLGRSSVGRKWDQVISVVFFRFKF